MLTSHPPPPLGRMSVPSDQEFFYCITSPCGDSGGGGGSSWVPYSTAPATYLPSAGSGLFSLGDTQIDSLGTFAGVVEGAALVGDALVDAVSEDPSPDPEITSLPDIGGDLPVALPPPIQPPSGSDYGISETMGYISADEIEQINRQLEIYEDSLRPVVEVSQEEADQYLSDRDSILARTGRDPDSLPPELNPILLVNGEPIEDAKSSEAPQPGESAVNVRAPYIGPPVFLGSLGETPGEIQPDPYEARLEEQPMADLSDIFGAIGDRIVGSLDFDPATPGIFGGTSTATSSLPDIIGRFSDSDVGGDLTPRSTPVQVNIDPRTGRVSKCAPRRRRRRLLTKSDIADISTMAALLGKNSESFKVWLAKATR